MFETNGYVSGDLFYGRLDELERLKIGILEYQNITIFGLPRIGKTSLYKEALIRFDKCFVDKGIKFFEFVLSGNDDTLLFRDLASFIENFITNNDRSSDDTTAHDLINQLKNSLSNEDYSYIPFVDLCDYLFLQYGYRFCIILDEFDRAAKYMLNRIEDIREMIQSKGIFICTVSHSPLSDLFPYGNGSDLPTVINYPMPLKTLAVGEGSLVREALNSSLHEINSSNIPNKLWNDMLFYTGMCPFLLNLFFNEMLILLMPPISMNISDILIEKLKETCWPSYTTLLKSWTRFFWKVGIMSDIVHASNGENFTNDLKVYGILLEGNHFITEYFYAYIKEQANSTVDIDDQFINDLNEISSDAKYWADKCSDKLRQAGRGVNEKSLRQIKKELEAINIKITSCIELHNLEVTIASIIITISEMNGFRDYINNNRRVVENA